MGLFKTGAKKVFITAPLKVILLPARVSVPKSVQNTHKFYTQTLTKAKSYLCPACGDGYLTPVKHSGLPEPELDTDSDNTQGLKVLQAPKAPPPLDQVWECSTCFERIETTGSEFAEVGGLLSNKGRELYENGIAYQDRMLAINDGRLLDTVIRKVQIARMVRLVSFVIALMFFIGIYKGSLMFCLTIILFSTLIFMNALVVSYRAWQLYTDNVFVENPKEQFHWWFANEKWFAYPNDYNAGLNSYSEEYYEDEDEIDTENGYDVENYDDNEYDDSYESYTPVDVITEQAPVVSKNDTVAAGYLNKAANFDYESSNQDKVNSIKPPAPTYSDDQEV